MSHFCGTPAHRVITCESQLRCSEGCGRGTGVGGGHMTFTCLHHLDNFALSGKLQEKKSL